MSEPDDMWVHHEELAEFQRGIKDKRLKAFIDYGVTTALMRRTSDGAGPTGSFDLLFFAKTLESMFERSESMRSILLGDPDELRWWSDEG